MERHGVLCRMWNDNMCNDKNPLPFKSDRNERERDLKRKCSVHLEIMETLLSVERRASTQMGDVRRKETRKSAIKWISRFHDVVDTNTFSTAFTCDEFMISLWMRLCQFARKKRQMSKTFYELFMGWWGEEIRKAWCSCSCSNGTEEKKGKEMCRKSFRNNLHFSLTGRKISKKSLSLSQCAVKLHKKGKSTLEAWCTALNDCMEMMLFQCSHKQTVYICLSTFNAWNFNFNCNVSCWERWEMLSLYGCLQTSRLWSIKFTQWLAFTCVGCSDGVLQDYALIL